MFEGKPINGAARQVVAIWLATVIIAIGPLCAAHAAQHTAAMATTGEGAATPPEIHELLTLLADPKNRQLLTLLANPKIQKWLEEQGETKAADRIGAGDRQFGRGLPKFPSRRDPRTDRWTGPRHPRSAQPVRASRRPLQCGPR